MRRPSVLMLVVWLAVVSVVIGCALSPPVQRPPSPSQATAKAVGSDYIIGPGDTLRIVRVESGRETTIHAKVADLVNSGDVRENVPLKPRRAGCAAVDLLSMRRPQMGYHYHCGGNAAPPEKTSSA